MEPYYALCDGEEEHYLQLGREEAVRDLGQEAVNEADEEILYINRFMAPWTIPRVPSENCPECWFSSLVASEEGST